MKAALFSLLSLLAFASPALADGTIKLDQVAPFRRVELENGATVPLRTGVVHFPDGAVGLLVDYVSSHPQGSDAVEAEIPFVWWEAIPEVKRRGYTQGWVRALDRIPDDGAEFRAQGYRACLAPDGSTLWLHLDGGLHEEDRTAGKSCM